MFCAYPRCFHLAAVRCPTCGQRYCEDHCSDWVARQPGEYLQECELCKRGPRGAQARRRERDGDRPPPGPVTVVGGMGVFLLMVAVGTAIDISARANGFIILWIFALAL